MTELERISESLRRWVKQSGLSYSKIAERSDVSKRTVINFMQSGKASWKVLEKLIKARDDNGSKAA